MQLQHSKVQAYNVVSTTFCCWFVICATAFWEGGQAVSLTVPKNIWEGTAGGSGGREGGGGVVRGFSYLQTAE